MIPHNECSGRAQLRGNLEQVLPQPRISLVWPMTGCPDQPYRAQLLQADLLSPRSNACLLQS